ncbi:hypothetical protein CERSUDRAFT_96433 [Gelatoporia subvermispora B]|uniref:F-box domain-containing protein n=1 Tax=Ceriporiopsis subvermispora (strain B) TaxID=914234 RepID=M2QTE1_CERS8|nr:hypothetical protein CERSUDRAFT_96433 [Gelatoporia subvermispora B]
MSLWRGEIAKKGDAEVTLDAFCSHLLDLECLRVDKVPNLGAISLIPRFTMLRTLQFGELRFPLSGSLLKILSPLPNLERLSIGFPVETRSVQDEVPSSTPSSILPSLQDLALMGCSNKMRWFLQCIQTPQLRSLAIEDPTESYFEEYCALVETMVDKCAPTLRSLSIRVEDHVFGNETEDSDSSVARLLQRLLPLPDIQAIRIHFAELRSFTVYDSDFITIGRAWSELKHLEISGSTYHRPTMSILPEVAGLCPQLISLVLPLMEQEIPDDYTSDTHAKHTLQYLQIQVEAHMLEYQVTEFVDALFSTLGAHKTICSEVREDVEVVSFERKPTRWEVDWYLTGC